MQPWEPGDWEGESLDGKCCALTCMMKAVWFCKRENTNGARDKNETGWKTLRTPRIDSDSVMRWRESETLEKYKVGTNARRGLRKGVQPIFPASPHHHN